MKKIFWTVIIAVGMACLPVGGTALAGQNHGKQVQTANSGKHHKKAKHQAKHKSAKKHAHASKHGHKSA